jgi:hypothetical protein
VTFPHSGHQSRSRDTRHEVISAREEWPWLDFGGVLALELFTEPRRHLSGAQKHPDLRIGAISPYHRRAPSGTDGAGSLPGGSVLDLGEPPPDALLARPPLRCRERAARTALRTGLERFSHAPIAPLSRPGGLGGRRFARRPYLENPCVARTWRRRTGIEPARGLSPPQRF